MAAVGSGVDSGNTFKVFSIHPPLLESGKTSTRLAAPRGTPYWFETASAAGENLVILRFGARLPNSPAQRLDVGQRVFAVAEQAGGVTRPVKVREGAFFNG